MTFAIVVLSIILAYWLLVSVGASLPPFAVWLVRIIRRRY